MRVIAGKYKWKSLETPEGRDTRPTSSRVREALFDILQARMRGARFLDLYAGTGSIGIEALSREARECTFVEKNPYALKILRSNLRKISSGREARVLAMDAMKALHLLADEGSSVNLFFADPPYDLEGVDEVLRVAGESGIITPGGIAVIQHDTRKIPDAPSEWGEVRRYKYGGTTLSLFRPGLVTGEGDENA